MYVNKKFSLKPVNKIINEINMIPEKIRTNISRIFLADGDAVIYPYEGLMEILTNLNKAFPNLKRISAYAGPHAIRSKNRFEWSEISRQKLTLLYFGLESGNNEVLELMKKDMKADEIMTYILELQNIGINFSVMAILGGGGKKLSEVHALDTAYWISRVNPKYFSLLTLFIRRKKDYFRKIDIPTIGDLVIEARKIIENINGKNIIFRSNHISNFITLAGILSKDKYNLCDMLDNVICKIKSQGLFNKIPDFYQEDMGF
jgi:radical SAM superfamily enzyme YgiQ (UPF0313 family)